MNSYYGNYRQRKFDDVFDNAADFLDEWKDSGLYKNGLIADTSITTLFFLLYARYGNSIIAASDENRFAYNLFSIIWQYGPSWEKRLDIQSKLRALTDDDLAKGTQAIYNEALNPQMTPGTDTLASLEYINSQRTTNYKKSKMDAYTQLWSLIDLDVTEDFLSKFKKLFMVVVSPELPLWYESEEEQ